MTITDNLQYLFLKLGIPEDYASRCAMPVQAECQDLVSMEPDVFGREPMMNREAYLAWCRMCEAAQQVGISLQVISAYRSHQYQADLLARKLAKGEAIADILCVNAAPGYSEHHSGKALDIGTPGFAHLEEEFEHSPAFAWLSAQAADFGFRMSFPRNNAFGVLYEPWHWYYCGKQ